MHPSNRAKLANRVANAAEAALAAQKYVAPVDVLVGVGWLDGKTVTRWRRGQIEYLERAVQTNLPRISVAMKLFRSWATAKGLFPSETAYVARTPQRQMLRFGKSGNPTVERLYRTHWLSPELSDKKRARLAEKVEPQVLTQMECSINPGPTAQLQSGTKKPRRLSTERNGARG